MAVEASINSAPVVEEPGKAEKAYVDEKGIYPTMTSGSDNGGDIDLKVGEVLETLDDAELFLREHNISPTHLQALLTDEEYQKKIVRRLDLTLLPLLMGTYLLQYIDKQALSYGAVFDLLDTTHTSSSQYSWLASIFYFAYLISEWPSSYLAQHFPTGTVVSIFTITWGVVLMCTAASSSFAGLAVCRFLLGVFEAPVTPCFMMIVGMWYTRAEQPARAGAFYCCNGLGSMIGGILFYAVGQAKTWDVWRIIFIICGGLTICWGFVLLFFLPNNIITAKRYTVEEKAMLIARSKSNQTGVFTQQIKVSQIKEAFCDSQIWLLFFFVLLNEIVNGGIANFGKLIVKGVSGGDALLTTAYGIPYGAWTAMFIFTGPFLASKFNNIRTYVMILYVCPTIVAAALFWNIPRKESTKNGLLMAYYICPSFVASLVLALQMPATNVSGYTKRVTATSLVFLAYCVGNIIGPQAFLAKEAPIYQTGCKLIIGCNIGQILIAIVLRFVLIARNKKRDAEAAAAGTGNANVSSLDYDDEVVQDITDKQNKKFRYSY